MIVIMIFAHQYIVCPDRPVHRLPSGPGPLQPMQAAAGLLELQVLWLKPTNLFCRASRCTLFCRVSNDPGMVRMPVYGAGCHLLMMPGAAVQTQQKLTDQNPSNFCALCLIGVHWEFPMTQNGMLVPCVVLLDGVFNGGTQGSCWSAERLEQL